MLKVLLNPRQPGNSVWIAERMTVGTVRHVVAVVRVLQSVLRVVNILVPFLGVVD